MKRCAVRLCDFRSEPCPNRECREAIWSQGRACKQCDRECYRRGWEKWRVDADNARRCKNDRPAGQREPMEADEYHKLVEIAAGYAKRGVTMNPVPDECRDLPLLGALTRYVEQGAPVGGFLAALLANDLVEAYSRADDTNSAVMREYAILLYNALPALCWGSRERVRAWIDGHADAAAVSETEDEGCPARNLP